MRGNDAINTDTPSVPILRVVGLMSGTSLDGCDAVLTEISAPNGEVQIKVIDFVTHPMPASLRERIEKQICPETSRIDELARLDVALGEWFVDALDALLQHTGLPREEIDLIGSHGQTVWHEVHDRGERERERVSWQLGDGSVIASLSGITTVCDFRPADVALSGQGAPLVPHFDKLMFGRGEETTMLLNIGGIGNLTLLPAHKEGENGNVSEKKPLLGFDTGPGNMIIDRFAHRLSDGEKDFDEDGRLAAQGVVSQALLQEWMQHEFFSRAPPRSTGREQFGIVFADVCWEQARERGLSPQDAIATATAFTAESIGQSLEMVASRLGVNESEKDCERELQQWPALVIVSGGGAKNPTLMRMLATRLAPAVVTAMPERESDAKEAVAFALYAYLAVNGRSNHSPSSTGASRETVLGKICPGGNFSLLFLNTLPRHFNPQLSQYKDIPPSYAHQCILSLPDALPLTETRNSASAHLDSLTAQEMVAVMSREDLHAVQCVSALRESIASLAERCAASLSLGGRVFYVGAGTSGRLGCLDAAEIPPTFSAPPHWFVALIAGGDKALRRAAEGAEDNREQGGKDLLAAAQEAVLQASLSSNNEEEALSERDTVLGIASSGSTPFVMGALQTAKQRGAFTALFSCNPFSPAKQNELSVFVDNLLCAVTGPEILTGSTRLKGGTATKLFLNQLSTTTMALMGKTLDNLMVDVRATNGKLRRRAIRIVHTVTCVDEENAARLLSLAGDSVKLAIAIHATKQQKDHAEELLRKYGGRLGKLLMDFPLI